MNWRNQTNYKNEKDLKYWIGYFLNLVVFHFWALTLLFSKLNTFIIIISYIITTLPIGFQEILAEVDIGAVSHLVASVLSYSQVSEAPLLDWRSQ